METRDDLLRPSFEEADEVQPSIYSVRAGYLTAFFGGPFAAIAMATLNSVRLRRLTQDALPIVAAAAITVGLLALATHPSWIGIAEPAPAPRELKLAFRLSGLLVFTVFWLLHRRFYRGAELIGLEPPNPWVASIGCIILGSVASSGLMLWMAP